MIKDGEGLSGVIDLLTLQEVTGAVNSPWIKFPGGSKISVIVKSTGSASLEITNASKAAVEADTAPAASIIEWDLGSVSAGQSVIEVCSAFRLKGVSGDSSLYGYSTKIQ